MDKINEQLYITDIKATREEKAQSIREEVDVIINYSKRYHGTADIYYPLADRKMKSQERFAGAVKNLIRELRNDKNVCVHCAAGISRSVTVAATALAVIEESNWVAEFQKIKDERNQANPNPQLRNHARQYLGEVLHD